jgi:hypothetical protein
MKNTKEGNKRRNNTKRLSLIKYFLTYTPDISKETEKQLKLQWESEMWLQNTKQGGDHNVSL